jgi:TatD DNase family protein
MADVLGQFVDAHCHLDDPRLDLERDQVIARARQAGIGRFVLVGTAPDTWSRTQDLCKSMEGTIWTAGIHPVCAAALDDAARTHGLNELRRSCLGGELRPRAVGEIGLDRVFAAKSSLPRQIECLGHQLKLARDLALPVVLHVVEAHGPTLDLLSSTGRSQAGGMVHAFGGSIEVARRYLAFGFKISFGCTILRQGANRVRDVAQSLPLGAFLLESDAPDLPPPGNRGNNEPANLLRVADCIAELRGVTAAEVLAQASANAVELFGAWDGK